MPNKYEEYYELAKRTEENLTRSKTNWTAFLDTAARVYKYPYSEQLLIFAQRPEATACAEFSVWSETMNRFVKKGSKGIALLDKGNKGDAKIRYVFDVADTGTTPKSKNVNLWELTDEHEKVVVDRLNERYGMNHKNVVAAAESAAAQLIDEFWNANSRYIGDILEGSFLEEYDEDNIGTQFRNAAVVSTTYVILSRCGINPEK